MHNSTITLKDVANAAGIAESTASRILSSAAGYKYSDEAQLRVREAAARLGYQANAAARLLKQQKKNLVGLAVRLTVHPYLNRLTIAVRDELTRQGYEAVLVEPPQLLPSHTSAPFPSLEMLSGVLSLDLSIDHPGHQSYESLRRKLPVVALYPIGSKEIDWVYSNNALGIEMLVDHLIHLGHRRLLFVGSPDSQFAGDHLKLKGWKRAISKHKLSTQEARLISLNPADDVTHCAECIEEAILAAKPRPTAALCSGDESALCVAGRLLRRGWSIPRDLSITGYDGIDFSGYSHPALTTVVQPVEAIAQAGVNRLLEIIEQGREESLPQQKLVKPHLLVRDSTAKCPTRPNKLNN